MHLIPPSMASLSTMQVLRAVFDHPGRFGLLAFFQKSICVLQVLRRILVAGGSHIRRKFNQLHVIDFLMRELSLEFEVKQLRSLPGMLDSGRATPSGTPIALNNVPGRPLPSASTPTSMPGLGFPELGLRFTRAESTPRPAAEPDNFSRSDSGLHIHNRKGTAEATPSRRLDSLKPLPSLPLFSLKPADRNTDGQTWQAASGTESEAPKHGPASTPRFSSGSGRKPSSGNSLGVSTDPSNIWHCAFFLTFDCRFVEERIKLNIGCSCRSSAM